MKTMRSALVMLLAVAALAWSAAPASAITADEVIKNAVDAYMKLQSYSYTNNKEGLDTFAKKQASKMQETNKGLADSAGVKVEEKKTTGADKMTYAMYNIKFAKPYILQMQILRLDLAPDLVLKGKFTYNAAKDPKTWWAKLAVTPTPLKRSVKKDDASGFLTMGWDGFLLDLQNFAANGKVKYAGTAKALGVECHVLEITFPDWNKFKPITPDFAKFKIPADIQHLVKENLADPKEKKYSSVKYWITKKDFHVIQVEKYRNGKFYWRDTITKIKINNLKKEDFSTK
jgi:hypothetical protein